MKAENRLAVAVAIFVVAPMLLAGTSIYCQIRASADVSQETGYKLLVLYFVLCIVSASASLTFMFPIISGICQMTERFNKILSGQKDIRCSGAKGGTMRSLEVCINETAELLYDYRRKETTAKEIDSQTMLLNFAGLKKILKDKLSLNEEGQALFRIAIDYMKNINEEFGYETGDKVLVEVAQAIREFEGGNFTCGRLCSDEFLAFVDGTVMGKDPEMLAEAVIEKLDGVKYIDEKYVPVSVSIGIAYLTNSHDDLDILVNKSGRAMYKAKDSGKNTYVIYDENEEF